MNRTDDKPMKRILTIQDLSCVGKCSLTVILPVISAMGVECSVLPTAVLSTHTAFPKPHVTDLSREIPRIADHWRSLDIKFSGIMTGYLADPAQAALAGSVIDAFGGSECLLLCDPAMADHGKLYSGLDVEMIHAMHTLCQRADLCLPNITEGALLAGMPYRKTADAGYCREITQTLHQKGIGSILLTGLEQRPGQTGFFWSDGTETFAYSTEKLPRSCHGTGDLFAAVVMGGRMQGLDEPKAGALAAEFVKRCIAGTGADSRLGVAFEPELKWLIKQL